MAFRSLKTAPSIFVGGSLAIFGCVLTWHFSRQIKGSSQHTTVTTSKNMSLNARTLMITGASRGLGLEFVRQITKLPSSPEVLIAACRNPSTATDLQSLAKENPSIKIVKLDVEKDEDIESAYKEVKAILGDRDLNLLINNAAIYDQKDDGKLAQQTRSRLQKHFDVNVSGPLMVTQKFLPLIPQATSQNENAPMTLSRAGIVMMTSYMGSQQITFNDGAGESYHYKTSKTALNMVTIMLARELKERRILAIAVHPGWVRTDMGGKEAFYSPEESIKGCLKVLGSADGEVNGKLVTFEGNVLPY